MQRQNGIARNHDYSFLRTSGQVERFVGLGLLVKLAGNADYELARVSFPYARPGVKTFVERLASQYRAACGEKLVVTSLTRPEARQPRNASDLSVHPAGMAVDLRVSRRAECRKWLESTLLSLEKRNVIDATRERYPPHYHVAVFPDRYERYVAALTERNSTRLAAAEPQASPAPAPKGEPAATTAVAVANVAPQRYEVRPGDTLWGIARQYGLTVDQLKAANRLASARIVAGQTLKIAMAETPAPASAAAEAAATLVAAASVPAAAGPSEPATPAQPEPALIEYEVRPGDTLWDIARRHGITVEQLKNVNNLPSARIKAGQTLSLPSP